MNRKDKRKRKPRKKKITVNKEFSKDEADVRALMKSREILSAEEPNSDIETDFFCRTLPVDEEDDNRSGESSQANIQDTASNLENLTTLLASAYVNIEETNPVCKAPATKVSKDADLLYIPSGALPQIDQQRESTEKDVQDEGLFIDDFEKLEGKNVNRLINRYLEEGYKGNLEALARRKHVRDDNKLYKTYSEAHFEPIYYEPKALQHTNDYANENSTITVYIKELVFTSHPLFSEENDVAIKLKSSFETYNQILIGNTIPKLSSELTALRNIFNDLLAEENGDKAKLQNYTEQIKSLRTQLHSEERALKLSIFDCIENWKSLKNIRKKQTYSTTGLKLSIRIIEKDIEMARKHWAERFETELNETMREAFDEYYRNKKKYSKKSAKKPNTERIKEELEDIFENDLMAPEEPNILLEMGSSEITKKVLDETKKYYVKVLFDNKAVCCTRDLVLNGEFMFRIQQTFAIDLKVKLPEEVVFELHEKLTFLPDKKISDVRTSILNSESVKPLSLELTSTKYSIKGALHIELCIAGGSLGRAPVEDIFKISGTPFKSPSSKCENITELNEESNSEREGTISSNRNQDENDDNSDADHFTFTEELETFCSKKDFDNNKRFKMLIARYRNEIKFKDRRFIPTFDKELEEEPVGRALEGIDWLDPIDVDKHKGKKYIRTLYQLILNHCERLNRNEGTENLLIGDEQVSFSSIISALVGIFISSRPLNPSKSLSANIHTTNCSKFNIIINVVRATSVPYRQFESQVTLSRASSGASLAYQVTKPANVRSYVSVQCKEKILRTTSTEGSNPTWNEQLAIPFSYDNIDAKDDIVLELYDEYIEDLLSDELARASEVYQRIHTNWLGELKIPLCAILSMKQVEGVFELDSPKILLGYSKPSLDTEADIVNIENVPEIKRAVNLSLRINVEPYFEMPTTPLSHLECSELRELKTYIRQVCMEFKESFADRFIDPLISTVDGKRICITRLLEPLPLPFVASEESDAMLRRYISLFSVFRTTSSCAGLQGVWFSNQIIQDSSWASPKDLGVLLCCFYLSIETPAALVLGVAYPYGDTTFVLLKQSSDYVLVDPTSGRKHASNDPFCPLAKVYCIVREDNVFFNIQSETRVSMTDFNTEDKSNWLPVFNKKHPAPNGEFHKTDYVYREPYDTSNLLKAIERKVMKKINSWRTNRKTVWNRSFQDMLYNVLIELERDALFDRDENVYMDRITKSFPNHKIFGFTLNFSYTSLSTISERVKATGIHLNTDKNVEFSLAVHIQQYPNNILSVWIFIITAVPVNVQ